MPETLCAWSSQYPQRTCRRVHISLAALHITPKDMLAGNQQEIQAERDRKLDAAKQQRKNRRQGAA